MWFLVVFVICTFSYLLYHSWLSPLASIPGPFLARFSRIWLVFHGYKGDLHAALSDVHARYGATVRVGPDEVVTTNLEAIKTIYGRGNAFQALQNHF